MTPKLPIVVLTLSSLCFTSCTKSVSQAAPRFLTQHLGEPCTVEFRRDALGAGATLPIPPTTDSQNGATVCEKGKLVAVEGEGIAVENAAGNVSTLWIPYHAILNVIFQEHK